MGNVLAVGPVPSPPMAPSSVVPAPPQADATGAPPPNTQPPPEPVGPGLFGELHKKNKELHPEVFEGVRFVLKKMLSPYFQASHTVTMSSYSPSCYKYNASFTETKQYNPGEPEEGLTFLLGDYTPHSGGLTAVVVHSLSKITRCRLVSQFQKGSLANLELAGEHLGPDFSAAVTMAPNDILSGTGALQLQYLRNITPSFAAGADLQYVRDQQNIPGGQMAVCSLGARYASKTWQFSANCTPSIGALHGCYYQKLGEDFQVGAELECNPRNQEATGTIAYQVEIPATHCVFRGKFDSNLTVEAVLEKRLQPLPSTLGLSAMLNHQKNAYKFGISFTVGE